jgi:hypothetical protein
MHYLVFVPAGVLAATAFISGFVIGFTEFFGAAKAAPRRVPAPAGQIIYFLDVKSTLRSPSSAAPRAATLRIAANGG